MTRIRELKQRAELPPESQQAFDEIVASRGSIRGPFGVLLHVPELARRGAHLGGYLRYESSIAPRVRETAVMATASLQDCDYEWAAHEPLAMAAGVPASVIAAIRAHQPSALAADDRDIYDLAAGIIRQHRVPDDLFSRLQDRLGEDGLIEIVAAIGYWSFVASILNTFEVMPPSPYPPEATS
jgi:4-carboxymuconolactone decarboxylase